MNAHPSSSNRVHRLVIFIITCAVLWTQFFGFSHSIKHGWNATSASSGLILQKPKAEISQQIVVSELSDNGPFNSSVNHNCFAWDSCSLTTAVFLSVPTIFASSLIFFLSALRPFPKFSYKLPRYFLSRAPPQTPRTLI